MGGELRALLEPLNTIVLWCLKGFKGTLNCNVLGVSVGLNLLERAKFLLWKPFKKFCPNFWRLLRTENKQKFSLKWATFLCVTLHCFLHLFSKRCKISEILVFEIFQKPEILHLGIIYIGIILLNISHSVSTIVYLWYKFIILFI